MSAVTADARPQGLELESCIQKRLLNREEYHLTAERVFGTEEDLELLEGEIYRMSPQRRPHRTSVRRCIKALEAVLPGNLVVWAQLPLALAADSEPEPDVLVLQGPEEQYDERDPGPADVALVVEVADASLAFDRERKAVLYARAGIADYWIVNLRDRQVEILREPGPVAEGPEGCGYRSTTIRSGDEPIAPLAAPASTIRTADLLPGQTAP